MQLATKGLIDRPNLSEPIAASVRGMILEGTLQAGARVNEVHLSEVLGVSRTPLREALIRLVGEGAVINLPRAGFFVRPLTTEELDEIYPIRAILDPEALRLAGLPPSKELSRLTALNAKLARARDAASRVAIDDDFHLALLARCPNRTLIGLIEQFILRTRRYELALLRDNQNLDRSTQDHRLILSALRKGDLEGACAAVRQNMESGKEPIAAWLRKRESR
jgi:DNA-binding GntR family transcriptional regulator